MQKALKLIYQQKNLVNFQWKLFRNMEGSTLSKLQRFKKYTELYKYHRDKQIDIMETIVKSTEQEKSKESFMKQLNIKLRLRQFQEDMKMKTDKLKQKHESGQLKIEAKGLTNQFFNFLSIYYQSLQHLVEGRRQVLNNPEFIFEDGKKIKEKEQQFQVRLSKLIGKALKKKKQVQQ